MRYLLEKGWIVTPFSTQIGTILIKGSKISHIFTEDEQLPAIDEKQRINCRGKYILPGIIDPHVHLRDLNQIHKETIESGTQAAISNGITSIIAMPNTSPPLNCIETIKKYTRKIRQTAHCNVGIYAKLPSVSQNLREYCRHLKKLGVFGIKIYPGDNPEIINWEPLVRIWEDNKEEFNEYIDDQDRLLVKIQNYVDNLYSETQFAQQIHGWEELFMETAKSHLHLLFHADVPLDSQVREIRFKTFDAIHKSSLVAHSTNYNKLQELLHIFFIFKILNSNQSFLCPPITFCHVSSMQAIQLIEKLRKDLPHIKITIEITPHHTYLSQKIELPYSSHGKVLPPLRLEEDNLYIQHLLHSHNLSQFYYGSDHAPHSEKEKAKNFLLTPSGFPSLDVYSKYILSKYFENEWDLRHFTFYSSYNPARIYHIKKRGLIYPGYFADLIIFEKVPVYSLNKEDFKSTSPICPYPLNNIQVLISDVFLNGKNLLESKGTFIARSYNWKPTH
ncbi:MAG: dihydroorotase family protein [Candidatus Lokiarchaeota archaeon]|nr:dihydroorotase family protein [Candidatus Lokiarchaeota archaeon]